MGSWSQRILRTMVRISLRQHVTRQIHEEGTTYFSELSLLKPTRLSLFSFPDIIKKLKELRRDFFVASKYITD